MTRVAMVGKSKMLELLAEALAVQDESLCIVKHLALAEEDPADVVVAWNIQPDSLGHFPRARLIHSPAAGCDHVLNDPSLPASVPVCRVVDPFQREGMTAFVLWAVLYYQRDMDTVLEQRRQHEWKMPSQKPLASVQVGVLGLGKFGAHAAHQLAQLGLSVRGWSRSAKQLEGIACYHGQDQFNDFLHELDVLVCLLPLTSATEGILNLETFRQMAPQSVVVNLGRGQHLVEKDLFSALDEGCLRGALLDVFQHEPLPAESPLWRDSRILVTPHMASAASLEVVTEQILANIQRLQRHEPLVNQIDTSGGY